MPVHHGGVPLTWNDTSAPIFGQGLGAAAPSDGILSVANPVDVTMDVHCLTFNENTQDRVYGGIQILHDLYIPSSGNITFHPHAHITFRSEPTTGRTVILKLAYVYAAPGMTATAAGQFAAAPTIIASTTYTTTNDTEIRKHLLVEFPDQALPASACAPSMAIMWTLKVDTSSTIDANCLSILFADWHYQQGPVGTIGEYA